MLIAGRGRGTSWTVCRALHSGRSGRPGQEKGELDQGEEERGCAVVVGGGAGGGGVGGGRGYYAATYSGLEMQEKMSQQRRDMCALLQKF